MTYSDLNTINMRKLMHSISENQDFEELLMLCGLKDNSVSPVLESSSVDSSDLVEEVKPVIDNAIVDCEVGSEVIPEVNHFYTKTISKENNVKSETVSVASAMCIAEERLKTIIEAGNADDFTIKKLKRQLDRLKNKIKRM